VSTEDKLYASNLLFVVAQNLRRPYSPHRDNSLLVDWEELQAREVPFYEFPPPVELHIADLKSWIWKYAKDRTHYIHLIRFLRTHTAHFSLIEWKYLVNLHAIYYVNRKTLSR
jgi:hypothetical protein